MCRGLVLDRIMSSFGKAVISARQFRMSYGIIHEEPYKMLRHGGKQRFSEDGRSFVLGRIFWVIRKGDVMTASEPLPAVPFVIDFSKNSMNKQELPRVRFRIVQFSGSPDDLPKHFRLLDQSLSAQVGYVEYDFNSFDGGIKGLNLEPVHTKFVKLGFGFRIPIKAKVYRAEFKAAIKELPAQLKFMVFLGDNKEAKAEIPVSWPMTELQALDGGCSHLADSAHGESYIDGYRTSNDFSSKESLPDQVLSAASSITSSF